MYGESSGTIRAELSTLLRQHRIQHRIGGPGMHTVPVTTTVAEREEIGRLMERYRLGVLTWCRQALASARPGLQVNRRRVATPDIELRRRLAQTMNASTAPLPTIADLTTPQKYPLVDAWRLAARAAALGEHDLAGDMAHGRLDISQTLTVIKDTSEIIRGLIVLDRRYANIPGWKPLGGSVTLQRAAEACAFLDAADYTVDRRGWRPPALLIDGPGRPGIAGVIQAEHNFLVHLNRLPNALNFRRILDSQRLLSNLLAARTSETSPELSAHWESRARTYAALHREARNLGGRIGEGSAAVTEAANAVSRLRRVPADVQLAQRALDDFSTLFRCVDHRIAELFEQGARDRLYFVCCQVPRVVDKDGKLTHRVRERFMPITSPVQTDLIRLVREELRPRPALTGPSAGARDSRLELTQAIAHRLQSRPQGLQL